MTHLLLCLVLAASLSVVGAARGIAAVVMELTPGVSQMVICGDGGPRLITLDSRGAEVRRSGAMGGAMEACQLCPDCLPGADFATPESPVVLPRPGPSRRIAPQFHTVQGAARRLLAHPARAPPLAEA